MTKLLCPPPGYATWIDYAVENMDTRELLLECLFASEAYEHWPEGTTREQMREAAQAELNEIRNSIKNQPEELLATAVQRNIKAGQEALCRARDVLITPGVKIVRKKGVPLFFGCEDNPGLMVRELNGKRTLGKIVGGRFRPIKVSRF